MRLISTAKKYNAFSLVEILLAVGLFALAFSTVAFFSVEAIRASRNASKKTEVALYMQETFNAVIINKDQLWSSIIENTNAGPKHLAFVNNTYTIADGGDLKNDVTISFQVETVHRDENGSIVLTGGTEDQRSRAIVITSSWTDFTGKSNSLSSTVYVNDWNTREWLQTTQADFNAGTHDFTQTIANGDGAVDMQEIVYADWCKPSLTLTSYDIPGQGVAQAITAIPGMAFIGTGANASGLSFAKLGIDPSDPPTVTVGGTYTNQEKTNAVFGESNYGYIATDTNNKEVIIVETTNYTQIGWFDAPGNTDGDSVYVVGNTGYVVAKNKLYLFDLTSKSGSRPQIGSEVTLIGNGKKIIVNGNYAYIAIDSVTFQLQIVDISNPNAMSIVGTAQVLGLGATGLYVNSDATRAYVTTANSAAQNEMFIVNVSTKTGVRPTISSVDTSGMSPKDVTVPVSGRAIVAGSGGTQQYQIFNIETETSPVKCGGLATSTGINGLTSIIESNNNAYSYILTAESASEFKIIKGGPGGGGADGFGHTPTATFTSQIFDTQSSFTTFYMIDWLEQLPTNTDLQMQIRSSNSATMVGATWLGPDGTSSTYFTEASGSTLPSTMNNKRYVQFQANFISDTISTPILEQLRITYQR